MTNEWKMNKSRLGNVHRKKCCEDTIFHFYFNAMGTFAPSRGSKLDSVMPIRNGFLPSMPNNAIYIFDGGKSIAFCRQQNERENVSVTVELTFLMQRKNFYIEEGKKFEQFSVLVRSQ